MDDHDPQKQHGWHLKKEIQLGHLLTTITVAVGVVMYVQKIEQRIALLEQTMTNQKERDDRQDKAVYESLGSIHRQLDRIDTKLDRLTESDSTIRREHKSLGVR